MYLADSATSASSITYIFFKIWFFLAPDYIKINTIFLRFRKMFIRKMALFFLDGFITSVQGHVEEICLNLQRDTLGRPLHITHQIASSRLGLLALKLKAESFPHLISGHIFLVEIESSFNGNF